MSDPLLSVIIPAHSEAGRIRSTLEQITGYFKQRAVAFEIVVVDDGSQDETFQITGEFASRNGSIGRVRILQNLSKRGKGFSVRRGMLEARGEYALFTDADLSTPIEEISKLEQEIMQDDTDIAFGSRATAGARVEIHQSWFRESSGKLFNHFVRILTGLPYRDTQCGFKLFKMSRCRPLFQAQTIDDFGFDVEILFLARKRGLGTKEVPVIWRHREGSKVRFFPDALDMLVDLFKIRWNDWRGKYGNFPL